MTPLYRRIFILPPWKEIYVTDEERKQSWEEALNTYDAMRKVYDRYGYDVLEVPKEDVEKRVEFILRNI
jgi:predicted ATPase